MAIEVLTKDDLAEFRAQLLQDLTNLVSKLTLRHEADLKKGYKTADVRKILGCSTNTLVALRVSKKIRTKKIGGVLYYNRQDVQKLLEDF